MHEAINQLRSILYGIWRRRWYAVAVAYLGCTIGWVVVAQIPDAYRSEARVKVDQDELLANLTGGVTVRADLKQQLEILRKTLVNTINLEKVVRRTDLFLVAESDDLMPLIEEMKRNITVSPQGDGIFRIAYISDNGDLSDPQRAELAKRVVSELLALIRESDVGIDNDALLRNISWLEQQILERGRALETAELRLAEFDRQYGMLVQDERRFDERLADARTHVLTLEKKLRVAQETRDSLQGQLAEVPARLADSDAVAAAPGSPDEARLQTLENRMGDLRLRGYTDQHPDILALQRQMDRLRERIKEAAEAAAGEDGGAPRLSNNPVYAGLQLKVSEVETQIVTLKAELEEARAEVADLEDKANQIPRLEVEKQRIRRDYSVQQGRYDELVERLDKANLTLAAQSQQAIRVQVLDPPTDPKEPFSPNRPVLLSGVLAGSVGAGLALAFVLSQLYPTFLSVTNLRSAFDLPVLGSITMVLSERQRRQRLLEVMVFSTVVGFLMLGYGGVMALELLGSGLI